MQKLRDFKYIFPGNYSFLKSFKSVYIILGILTFLIAIIILIILASIRTTCLKNIALGNPEILSKLDQYACTSNGCVESSATMLDKMNTSKIPCDNFYEYACGNFKNMYGLRPDQEEITLQTILRDNFLSNIRKIIENRHYTSFNLDSAEDKLQKFYSLCTDDRRRIENDGVHFVNLLKEKLGSLFLLDQSNWTNTWNFNDAYSKTQSDFLTNCFFGTYIKKNEDNNENIFLLMPMKSDIFHFLGNGTIHLRNSGFRQQMNIIAFKNYVQRLAKLILEDAQKPYDNIILANFYVDVVSMERNVQKYYNEVSDKLAKKMTLGELHSQLTEFDFLYLLKYMFPDVNLNEKTIVAVAGFSYFTKLNEFLGSKKIDGKRLLNNYLVYRIVSKFAPDLSPKYQEVSHFLKRTQNVQFENKPIWQTCMDIIRERLGTMLASVVINNFIQNDARNNAKEIVNNLQQKFIDNINKTSWMDKMTKLVAIDKIKNMKISIGLSDLYHEEDFLSNHYSDLKIDSTSYFNTYINILYFQRKLKGKYFTYTTENISDHTILFSDETFRNFFPVMITFSNHLIIPLAFMSEPVFQMGRSNLFNYAMFGSIIASKMMSSIYYEQDQIISYNAQLKPLFGAESVIGYAKLKKCFQTAFSESYTDPIFFNNTYYTANIDDTFDIDNAIMNYAGVTIAYRAYIDQFDGNVPDNEIPLVLTGETYDYLFFILYTQTQCFVKQEKKSLDELMQKSIPENIRTNVILQLTSDFLETYECKTKDPMWNSISCSIK